MMLDKVTLTNLTEAFTVKKHEVIPFEMPDKFWVSLTFEMNLDVLHFERKLYTYFDMLSDVGGLLGFLTAISSFILSIWAFQGFDNFMVSRLFKIRRPQEELSEEMNHFAKSDYIHLSCRPNLRNWLLSLIPKFCLCCKCCKSFSRRERALAMAREKLMKEANIIEIIKSRRYFNNAFKVLLSEKQQLDLKERSRYLSIDPDQDDEAVMKKAFSQQLKRL